MDANVKCEIETTGEACQEYIGRLSSALTPNECNNDVLYTYIGENIGTKCEKILFIESTIYSNDMTRVLEVPLTFWTESKKLFCPGESVTIVQLASEDLCAVAGTEVGIGSKINGEQDESKFGFIAFPIRNQIPTPTPVRPQTPAPVPQEG